MMRVVLILIVMLMVTGCTCVTPAPNQPPIAYIDSIIPAEAAIGTKAAFKGHGTDGDGTVVAYRWRSSIDGELSTEAIFETASLSTGKHSIYLKVQDNNGAWSEEIWRSLTVTSVAVTPPVINAFGASPSNVPVSQSSTLSWNVAGATSVSIDQGIGSVALTGTTSVSPTATTTYVLTATNEAGSKTASVQVVVSAVPGLPVITSFTAGPEHIALGSSSMLRWNVSAATSVSIDQGIGSVAITGTTSVSPTTTTTYVLTATNAAGSKTAAVQVVVTEVPGLPVITFFTAGPENITLGSSSTLRWNVSGATAVSVDPGMGNVTLVGEGSVSPAVTTTYTLTAVNQAGSATATARVVVTPAAHIPKIAFSSKRDGNYEIYTMASDGSNQTRLTNNGFNDCFPAWSPDGAKIAFDSDRDGNWEVYVMNADGSNQNRLTNNNALDRCPTWSPDGSKIAFHSTRDGNFEIYVMNANGTNPIRLTNSPGDDSAPSWSPDGAKIAFNSTRDGGNLEIYTMNADGSNQTRLTNNPNWDVYPVWSPDGAKIAFSSSDGIDLEIYVMNANGSSQIWLTNNSKHDEWPTWSPDGSQIAFQSNRDGGLPEIYVMNADGSSQTRLTNNTADDVWPDWR